MLHVRLFWNLRLGLKIICGDTWRQGFLSTLVQVMSGCLVVYSRKCICKYRLWRSAIFLRPQYIKTWQNTTLWMYIKQVTSRGHFIYMMGTRALFTERLLIWFNLTHPTHPEQNGRHFADDIFKCIFVNEKFCILIKISLKFVPWGPIDNNTALV